MKRKFEGDEFPGFESLETYLAGEEIPGGSGKGVLAADGLKAWRHTASGVRVVLFHAPGPLTSVNIALGTIPVSDAGHPHTLEHIIFLGSQNHPLRGYLDTLANRSLADGTNAYTDVSATVYQANAAGLEGMCKLVPCFLDHVLRPTINQKTFASEVYNVRANGKESGVVFSEMHGRENTEGDLSMAAMNGVLLGGTPLAYNSGGVCKEIRTLTADGIQQYHDDYYCGSNASVIIGGDRIPPGEVLGSLDPILSEIAGSQKYAGKKISWEKAMELTPMPPVTKKHVKFPCPDDEIGSLLLGWRGPPPADADGRTALEILLQYMTSTVSAPLQQKFVENDDPLSSDVDFDIQTFVCTSSVILAFSGVSHIECESDSASDSGSDAPSSPKKKDTKKKDDAEKKDDVTNSLLASGKFCTLVLEHLKKLATADKLEGGLAAVHVMIKREMESFLSGIEEESHGMVPGMLVDDVLYADALSMPIGSESRGRLARLKNLYEKDEQFWLDLMKTALVDAPRVEIAMLPDPDLADELAAEDQKRVEERVETIGTEELKRQAEINDKFIASLTSATFKTSDFPSLPSASKISRIPYKVSLDENPAFWQQSVAVDTDFVQATILLNTSTLTFEQRLVLPLISKLMLNADILLDDGSYVSYQDSAFAISEATVDTELAGVFIGYRNGAAGQCLGQHFTATPERFEEAAKLMLRALFQEEVTKRRLITISKNIMSDITEEFRRPEKMMRAASAMLCATGGGGKMETDILSMPNNVLGNIIGAKPLLAVVAEDGIKSEKVRQNVVKLVNETLMVLRTLPSTSIFVQIGGRDAAPHQKQFRALWDAQRAAVFEKTGRENSTGNGNIFFPPQIPIRRVVSEAGIGDTATGNDVAKAIGIPGVENCYIDVRVSADVHPGHDMWAPLFVLTEMLCRMEGPLSDAIRGSGLAYGYGISNSHWKGFIGASIMETASPVDAWKAMASKMHEMQTEFGKKECQETLSMDLDTAKAVTLYGLSYNRSTPEWIVRGAINDSGLGEGSSPDRDRGLNEKVEKVTLMDVRMAFDAYVMPLFRKGGRVAVLTCGPSGTKELIEKFRECEHSIEFEEASGEDLIPGEILEAVKNM